MASCPGCGGIVGRDCFNPQECEWICRDMEARGAAEAGLREQEEREYAAHCQREQDAYYGQVEHDDLVAQDLGPVAFAASSGEAR